MEDATIIVPIAHDLKHHERRVVVGQGTKLACDEAIRLARANPNSYILLSATWSEDYRVVMADVMREYIVAEEPSLKERIRVIKARRFNTVGEIFALYTFLKALLTHDGASAVKEVLIAVKDWHAFRTDLLAHEALSRVCVPYRIVKHRAPGNFIARQLEYLKAPIHQVELARLIAEST